MENPYDKRATLENVRERYGSVKEFCRQVPIHPRIFYRALDEGLGRCRRESFSRTAIERLREEALLVESASGNVSTPGRTVN